MVAVIQQEVKFSVHFDGPITIEHRMTLRVMAKTYEHMQRAIDRAYLINKHGNVWKHARLSAEDYEYVDFIAEYPQEGGIILDAVQAGVKAAKDAVDKIASVMREPYARALDQGLDVNNILQNQMHQRREYVTAMADAVPRFADLLEAPPPQWAALYSSRSILKEVDQLVGQVTQKSAEGSSVEIALIGGYARDRFDFSGRTAERFHKIVAARELGPAMMVNVKIRNLDRGNKYVRPKAKVLNLDAGREVVLHLSGYEDFELLHPYHTEGGVAIYASPLFEAGGYDLHGGDLVFVGIAG